MVFLNAFYDPPNPVTPTTYRQRMRGHPKTTWWRTVLKKLEEMDLSWSEV